MKPSLVAPIKDATSNSDLESRLHELRQQLDFTIQENRKLRQETQEQKNTVRVVEQSLIQAKMETATLRDDLRREKKRVQHMELQLGIRKSVQRHVSENGSIDVDVIIEVVCKYLGVERELLRSRVRRLDVFNAKFLICYFVYLCTDVSYDDAAEKIIGKRTHNFITYNRDQAMNYIDVDPSFRKMVKDVARLLKIKLDF